MSTCKDSQITFTKTQPKPGNNTSNLTSPSVQSPDKPVSIRVYFTPPAFLKKGDD